VAINFVWPSLAREIYFASIKSAGAVEMPARMTFVVPTAKGKKEQVLLDLSVQAVSAPTAKNIGGVVWISRPGSSERVEVGRFSLFPASSFEAADKKDLRMYQFNITNAVDKLNAVGQQAEVRVQLIDRLRGEVLPDATITLGDAKASVR